MKSGQLRSANALSAHVCHKLKLQAAAPLVRLRQHLFLSEYDKIRSISLIGTFRRKNSSRTLVG